MAGNVYAKPNKTNHASMLQAGVRRKTGPLGGGRQLHCLQIVKDPAMSLWIEAARLQLM